MYTAFMESTKTALQSRLGKSKKHGAAAKQMLETIFNGLMSTTAVQDVERAAGKLSEDGRKALGYELAYLAKCKFDADEAKTGKDSLENLLKLPKPIKELLHILNEVLKIVSGRGDQTSEPDP